MVNLTAIGAAAGFLTARHAAGELVIGGIDLMAGLASQSLLSFTYTDNTSDQADDLTVEIADPARTWMQTYLPKKGTEGQASIKVYNWIAPGDTRRIDCGVFWLDEIGFAGPPNTVTVKASSVPIITGIKNEKHYSSWEDVTLQQVAAEIAAKNGLALVWDTKENPKFKRTDQVETPDLEYLRDRSKDSSLSLKIYKRQLVMYSEKEYEARPPVYTMLYGASNILAYAFTSRLNDTYKKVKNAYVDPETGKLIEKEYEPDEKPEGTESELNLNEREEDESEDGGSGGAGLRDFAGYNFAGGEASDQKPKSKLREKNKREKECSITVVGNPDYLSGLNVQFLGWGIFDGKWFISSTVHSITSGGYTTELKMRGALNGY